MLCIACRAHRSSRLWLNVQPHDTVLFYILRIHNFTCSVRDVVYLVEYIQVQVDRAQFLHLVHQLYPHILMQPWALPSALHFSDHIHFNDTIVYRSTFQRWMDLKSCTRARFTLWSSFTSTPRHRIQLRTSCCEDAAAVLRSVPANALHVHPLPVTFLGRQLVVLLYMGNRKREVDCQRWIGRGTV